VRAWLDQLQGHWDEQLRSFGSYVERVHGGRGTAGRDDSGREGE